jgi:trans-2,3-dihydro-3-hydroxyanthranilate isomerase
MQDIAREMNLSETTFVQRRAADVESAEGVRVRIFTTEEELDFAGHPTLGTASLLRNIAPETVCGSAIRLALNVGTVPVNFEDQRGENPWPVKGTMTQKDPTFGVILEPAEVAALTGLAVADLDPDCPAQVVSTGTAFAIVPLRSSDALERLNVRQEEATAYLRARSARWFYVLGPTGSTTPSEPAWRARMQFYGGEDPATGSAAGCAISHLVARGAVLSAVTIHLRQGVEIRRPSDLFLSARQVSAEPSIEPSQIETFRSCIGEVRVGGSTVLVAKGQLFLP